MILFAGACRFCFTSLGCVLVDVSRSMLVVYWLVWHFVCLLVCLLLDDGVVVDWCLLIVDLFLMIGFDC